MINLETANNIMSQYEPDYDEEMDREYVPCFQLKLGDEFYSLVYWRASALNYEYYLVNIDKKGKLLDRRLIAGLIAENNSIVRMFVSIDINNIFYIAANLVSDKEDFSESKDAQTYSLEILSDGSIISS